MMGAALPRSSVSMTILAGGGDGTALGCRAVVARG